jgi:hypothetical protein
MNISITFKPLAISLVCLLLISTLVSCNQPTPTPSAARVSELEAAISTLEVDLADAEARVSVLETALVELAPTPSAARVSELEAVISALEVDLADAEARVLFLETTLAVYVERALNPTRVVEVEVVREVEEPALSFTKTFGGEEDDRAHSIQQTTDGGYIITGSTESFGAGNGDVYLVKIDGEGNEEWYRTFGGEAYDTAHSVQQTTDDGYIIAGSTESFGAGNGDVYLVKADEEGNEEWSRTFGGETYDTAHSVQQTTDGGYIIAGHTMHRGNGNVYLVKTDGEGNQEWSRTFGGEAYDTAHSVQQTTDGGYIIAGSTESFGTGGLDIYVIKTDGEGNGEWYRTFGGEENDRAYSVQQTADGGYIIAGDTESFGAGNSDVYLVKIDEEGDEEWSRTFGGEEDDRAYAVQWSRIGGYTIAGSTESFGTGNSDVYLVKIDEEGDEEWSRTFGGEEDDRAYAVQQTVDDGDYIIVGDTTSFGAGNSDVYVIEVSITITTKIEVIETIESNLS